MIYSIFILLSLSVVAASYAAEESMPSMPLIRAKKTFTVSSTKVGEDLQAGSGFGQSSDDVDMMNQMMVEGSGMEGMDMSTH